MFQTILNSVQFSLFEVWVSFGNIVVNIVIAFAIAGVLSIISIFASRLAKKALFWIRVDSLFEKIRLTPWFASREISFSFSGLIAWIVKWTGLIASLVTFLKLLNLQTAVMYLRAIGGFGIKALSAGIVLLVGLFIANFIKSTIIGFSRVLKLSSSSSSWVSGFVKWGIVIFTLVFALSEFQITQSILKSFLTAFLAMVALAGGIALGLSGKAWADRMIEKMRRDVEE